MNRARTKFEERNYPMEEPRPNYRPWLLIIGLGLGLIVAAYVGNHYWYGCTDWGFAKACGIIAK